MVDLGKRIFELRKARGLTLEAVGQAVGVGRSTVRKWENGIIANMRRDKIKKLAVALGTSPSYIMGWTDDPNEDPEAAKPATNDDDGLSDEQRKLIDLVKQCPDDQAAALLQAMKLFLQNWSK